MKTRSSKHTQLIYTALRYRRRYRIYRWSEVMQILIADLPQSERWKGWESKTIKEAAENQLIYKLRTENSYRLNLVGSGLYY